MRVKCLSSHILLDLIALNYLVKRKSYEAQQYAVFPMLPPLRLRSTYSSSHTPSLCSSLNMRDQISHPYETEDKIVF